METNTDSAAPPPAEGPSQAQGVQAALDKISGEKTAPATPEPAAEAAPPPPEPEKQAPAEPEDIWASVPEAARKEFESLQNKIKSDDGRVAKAMKELQEAKAQIEKLQNPQQPAPPKEEPSSTLASDYPEAKAFQDALEEQKTVIETLQKQMQTVTLGALDAVRPGWREMIATDEFKQWWVVQDADTQALYHSADLADNIKLLDSYQKTQDTKRQAADTVKTERAERLTSAQSLDARSSAGVNDRPVDNEAGFQAALKKVLEKNHMR